MLQKLEGHFVRWQDSPQGLPTSILIQTGTLMQSVRLSKNLRRLLAALLQPGMGLMLQAKPKKHHLQAKFVVLLPSGDLPASDAVGGKVLTAKPTTVQICTSKHCHKKGSPKICAALAAMADEANIKVREVGCMGHCRQAPIAKIGDRRYHQLSPKKVVELALDCCAEQ
jgi:Thioredoxin-like [2Fe-2S] ferredoxin